ncbi:unnamed protein product [Dovyalis caffra]|uniref:Uncharacterized protein n=1 Tax=Dovyalis caffra TaxID=77055 RepID=A0AAV1SFK8_9ROSI|nr:unnamed protein product [Dovyalis caffra]
MELRSCSHLHFIKTAEGGKMLNVFHGKPALKFKDLRDIYEIGEAGSHHLLPVVRPKLELEDLPIECDRAKAESPCMLAGATIKSKSKSLESNCSSVGDGGKSEIDDVDFSTMTLKQIKERCKAKKREPSQNVGLIGQTAETCSPPMQEPSYSQFELEEFEAMEPLSNWKSRILKSKKMKRKCRLESSLSSSSESASSIVKSEEIPSDQVIFQSSGIVPAPINIKVEVQEPISFEAISLLSSVSPSSEIKEEDSVVDSHAGVDPAGVVSLITDDSSSTYHDSQSKEPERVEHDFETHKLTFFCNELQCCVVNEESYEPEEHVDPKSMPDARASGGEIIMVDVAELTTDHNSGLSSTELKKESSAVDPHHQHCGDGSIEVAFPSKQHKSGTGNDFQNFPGMHELLEPNSDSQVQVPDISMVNISQSTELSNRHGLHLSEGGAKDDRPHVEATVISSPVSDFSSFRDSNSCSSQDDCLASATAEEKKSPLSACTDAARKFSAVPCIDEPLTLADIQGCHHSKLHLPERLLSTRKAISPTSQKKLCKAMEFSDLDDEEYYKYTRKLCYTNFNENKIGRLGRSNQNQRVDLTISPERIIRKPKNDRNGFHRKGILKVPHPSRTVPRFGTGCSSVQSCSESAISFSQQRMRDIEYITTKLTKELNSMKDIVQETWNSEVYPATPLKYSADEVKIAVQNATRVEESARRWLSIMARDCNRFCKIMKLTDKASATSGKLVHKEKRKIVFADEAGGKLCDVKTFEYDTAFVTGSSSDKSVNFDQ